MPALILERIARAMTVILTEQDTTEIPHFKLRSDGLKGHWFVYRNGIKIAGPLDTWKQGNEARNKARVNDGNADPG